MLWLEVPWTRSSHLYEWANDVMYMPLQPCKLKSFLAVVQDGKLLHLCDHCLRIVTIHSSLFFDRVRFLWWRARLEVPWTRSSHLYEWANVLDVDLYRCSGTSCVDKVDDVCKGMWNVISGPRVIVSLTWNTFFCSTLIQIYLASYFLLRPLVHDNARTTPPPVSRSFKRWGLFERDESRSLVDILVVNVEHEKWSCWHLRCTRLCEPRVHQYPTQFWLLSIK